MLMLITLSLKSRYSLNYTFYDKISVTYILFYALRFAYQLLYVTCLSTTSPNITLPLPQAPAQRVPSDDQTSFYTDPLYILLKE